MRTAKAKSRPKSAKTTVELAPELIDRVKKRAAEENVTFKAILESALWQLLKTPPKKRRRKMRNLSVGGRPVAGYDPSDWEQTRAIIYEGHGG